jgi:hypothetical protein
LVTVDEDRLTIHDFDRLADIGGFDQGYLAPF